jgi:hypothetical protein
MYCSSCGAAVPLNLSYCNRCGAKVGGAKGDHLNKLAELSPESLVWAVVSVFIIGLGAIVGLVAMMKDGGGIDPIILAVAMLSFMLMLLVEGVFIWLLLKRTRGVRVVGDSVPLEEQAIKELGAAQARVLAEPVPSVTEHTTRAFEPIHRERK